MEKKLELVEYTLPDWAASFLINNDASGITEDEKNGLLEFVKSEDVHFVEVKDDSSFFGSNDFDSLGGNCSTFVGVRN